MRLLHLGRFGGLGVAALCAVALATTAPVASAEPDPSPRASPASLHRAIGMFSVESDAGGAVWMLREDGTVRLIGPGEALAIGGWSAPDGDDRRFGGSIEVPLSDQTLTFKGEASEDGSAIALLVTATEPGFDAGKFNWPAESRLVGKRVGFRDVEPVASSIPDASPAPVTSAMPSATPVPIASADGECAIWDGIEGVGWGPCDMAPSPVPSPAAGPSTAGSASAVT